MVEITVGGPKREKQNHVTVYPKIRIFNVSLPILVAEVNNPFVAVVVVP
jgi:hypothetical protein